MERKEVTQRIRHMACGGYVVEHGTWREYGTRTNGRIYLPTSRYKRYNYRESNVKYLHSGKK